MPTSAAPTAGDGSGAGVSSRSESVVLAAAASNAGAPITTHSRRVSIRVSPEAAAGDRGDGDAALQFLSGDRTERNGTELAAVVRTQARVSHHEEISRGNGHGKIRRPGAPGSDRRRWHRTRRRSARELSSFHLFPGAAAAAPARRPSPALRRIGRSFLPGSATTRQTHL